MIVTRNTREITLGCLASIASGEQEVVVVDNASSDGTGEAVAERFPKVRVLTESRNVGFARANNDGAKVAGGDCLLFLNSDTLCSPLAVERLAAVLEGDSRLGAISPQLVYPDGRLQETASFLATPATEIFSPARRRARARVPAALARGDDLAGVGYLSGAALMVRREAFAAVGGFDDSFFFYCEDADLCRRIAEKGWGIQVVPEVRVVHLRGGSTTARVGAEIEQTRSKLQYLRKHHGRAAAAGVGGVSFLTRARRALFNTLLTLVTLGRWGEMREKAVLHTRLCLWFLLLMPRRDSGRYRRCFGDWEEKGKPEERWLVISYWANVEGITPSFHVDDRLPHLEAAGIKLEVLTSPCGPRPAGWGKRWHRVPSLSPSGIRFELRHLASGFPRRWRAALKGLLTLLVLPFYAGEKLLANVESTFWWWVSAGLVGLRVSRRREFDLIYSSGGALSAHLAAAWVARRRGIPWVAEIQDPLVSQLAHRGWLNRQIAAWTERRIHHRANGVVYLTQTACLRAQRRVGGRAACTAIYAGGEATAARTGGGPRECLQLLHAGSLAGTRNPEALLRALGELAARRPEWREQIRLTLLGSMDRASQRMVAGFPYPEMVEAIPKLPRAEALKLAVEADVLLVIQNMEALSEETIPSKTYDYLISGRPVLGLLWRNPELAGRLREAGHRAVEISDLGAIAAELEELHAEWRAGRLRATPDTRYTRAGAAAEFVAWAREIARRSVRKEEVAHVP